MKLCFLAAVVLMAARCGADKPGDDSAPDDTGPLDSSPVDSPPPDVTDDTHDSLPPDDTGPFDEDGDGWFASEDCDDEDATVYPGAADDFCDGVDHDCDGVVGVATFGGGEYPTIQDAMSAAGSGGTVSICPGTHTERLGTSEGQDLVLESYSGSYEDTVLSGEGTHRILNMAGGAVVELVGLSLMHGFDGADGGGAVHAQDAGFVLRDCHVADNESARRGGALCFSGVLPVGFTELALDGCSFGGNIAAESGGALYAETDTDTVSLRVSECRFEGNEGFEGGAIGLFSDHAGIEVIVEDSSFDANTATVLGGAVSCSSYLGSSMQFTDSSFVGNAASAAAALYATMRDAGALAVEGSDFQGNTSTAELGGAIYVAQAGAALVEISVQESWFSDNTAAAEAGALGLYAHADANVAISDTTFSGNACQYNGAAYFSVDGVLNGTLERVDVVDNTCTGTHSSCVGGMSVTGRGTGYLDISQGSIVGNVGTDYGGLWIASSEVSMSSTAVDWGEDKTDNSPYDLVGYGEYRDDLGTNETFTCDGGGCR